MENLSVADLIGIHLDPLGTSKYTDRIKACAEIPIVSVVGVCCSLVITKAKELSALLDPHPECQEPVLDAVLAHCEIIILG